MGKPKSSSKNKEKDKCQTPGYALYPLLPYLPKDGHYWDPCCGKRNLIQHLQANGLLAGGADIEEGPALNLFNAYWSIPGLTLLTNIPFSVKYEAVELFCLSELPFATIVPLEFIGSQAGYKLVETYKLEVLLLSRRVDFYTEKYGWNGGAQFPVIWLCRYLLPEKLNFGVIPSKKELPADYKEFI